MAYAHGLTKEDVFAVATELFGAGKNPTPTSIRALLGKGSFSTITKYLNEWKEEQTDAVAVAVTEPIPTDILQQYERNHAAIRSLIEASIISERIDLLEAENERLKEIEGNYNLVMSELGGLRFAYQESQRLLLEATRENERINSYLPKIEKMDELREMLHMEIAKNKLLQEAVDSIEVIEQSASQPAAKSNGRVKKSSSKIIPNPKELEVCLESRVGGASQFPHSLSPIDSNVQAAYRSEIP